MFRSNAHTTLMQPSSVVILVLKSIEFYFSIHIIFILRKLKSAFEMPDGCSDCPDNLVQTTLSDAFKNAKVN